MDQKGPSDKYTFLNPAFNFNQQYSDNVTVPIFNLPYDTRFITDSPYTGYHRFGSDPLFNRDVRNVNQMEHWRRSRNKSRTPTRASCSGPTRGSWKRASAFAS